MDLAISAETVREAAQRISPLAFRTPVLAFGGALFKCENLQRGGAFKIRGAANLILSIPASELARGVVAFSSGNHAQATAIAAKYVGARATIVMPEDAPQSKMEPTRALGARIITYNRFTQDREAIAADMLRETGGTLVPPFDDPKIIAGQGTAALELLDDHPDIDALVVCIGGGGLISGCATIAKSIKPGIRVFGVEPERANDTWLSLRQGERVSIPTPDTIADGLRAPTPGKLTFPMVQRYVEKILLVSEDEIRRAMLYILANLKVLAEPSGAVAAAAVIANKLPPEIKRPAIVISGGNVDFDFLKTLSAPIAEKQRGQ